MHINTQKFPLGWVHEYDLFFKVKKGYALFFHLIKKEGNFSKFLNKKIKDQILCQNARIKMFNSSLNRENMLQVNISCIKRKWCHD